MSSERDTFYESLWRFLRADLGPRELERWLCSSDAAEDNLGPALHLEAISTDFRSADAVDQLREALRAHARAAWPRDCRCIELADKAVVDMGDHEEAFRSIEETKKRGAPYWWLWAGRCRQCGQAWLVAQEERQNDIFCMRRLDASEHATIVGEDRWPPDFDTYEALLGLGAATGRAARFVDPLGSSSLEATIEELARNRPGIRVTEVARLLALDHGLARTLAERVIAKTGASILID